MMTIQPIACIQSPFPAKFGIPRQSGLVEELAATVVFEPAFRSREALRGLEDFSHLWLIWGFSQNRQRGWTPTVRPPRLGGNRRMGVFATRSPYRPNPLGLSSVRIAAVAQDPKLGSVIKVLGADLADGTPIYDIKPYLAYTDSHPHATGGFAGGAPAPRLQVVDEAGALAPLPEADRRALVAALAQDPRPPYQQDEDRVYGMGFAGFEVRFTVKGDTLTVHEVVAE